MIMFFSLVSCNASSSNKFIELGYSKYTENMYPTLFDTYALNSSDYEKYLVIASKEIDDYPNNAYMYYIKGYILLGYHGFLVRQSEKNGVSKKAYFSTEESRLRAIETESYFSKALNINKNLPEKNQLSTDIIVSLISKLESPIQQEKSIKLRIKKTSLSDLEGCPDDISEYEESECSIIAHSWEEFIYQQYSSIYKSYSISLDKKIWRE